MMNKKQLGIYIHIPFCVRKCAYCDFLSGPAAESVQTAYMRALLDEITHTAACNCEINQAFTVRTVFFGGGTPSAVAPEWIVQTMEKLRTGFTVAADAEVTIECNPGTLTPEKAAQYRECGINRISFGLQSADDEQLRLLGRIHTFEAFAESFETARAAGFLNLNVDMMSALPGQTYKNYTEGLRSVLAFQPEHLSAYSLILEEGTPLFEQIESFPALPDEDTERRMYYATQKILAEQGYIQYEISNFSKEGYECRHNLCYWDRTDYLGFGVGAASLFNGCRSSNLRDIGRYIENVHKAVKYREPVGKEEQHILSREECMEEFMFLGLRKTAGIVPETFQMQFGRTLEAVYGGTVERNLQRELLEWHSGRLRLTRRGVDVSNCVLSEFLLS